MRLIRFYKSLVIALVFPALCVLFFNNVANNHQHLISGYPVSHAHPFNKNTSGSIPYQPNKHTDKELLLLYLISNIQLVIPVVISLAVFRIIIVIIYLRPRDQFHDNQLSFLTSPRSPPNHFRYSGI